MLNSTMGSSGDCSCLPTKIPQFFKIILQNTMQERKLGIPRKFVVEYANYMQECVTLEVPDGAKWQIHLSKTQDGQVWMEQGWLDFAKHYSISYGNFLVFDPRGISKFRVVIFDKSGTEINYAPITPSSSETHYERDFQLRNNGKMKNATPSLCHRPHKRGRADDCNTCESGSSLGTQCGLLRKKTRRDVNLLISSPEFDGLGGCTSSTPMCHSRNGWKKPHFTRSEIANLLERAGDFKSSKPYFKVVIHPSALYRKKIEAKLEVPSEFAQKYFTQVKGKVILQNQEGRTWSIKYKSEAMNGRSRLRARLATGWKDFSSYNNLEVGDVCVFEMIKDSVMTLKVVIYRASKRGYMSSISKHQPVDGETQHRLNSKQKVMSLEKAQNFRSTKPYFKVILQSSSVYRENQTTSVNVPATFAKKYLANERGDVIIYDVKERTWSVSYHCTETGGISRARFRTGWKKFAEDNNLRVGDVCVFEMDNCKNITFKVNIFRKDGAANCFPSPGNPARSENEKSVGGDITNRWSCPILHKEANKLAKVKNEANEFTETFPCFSVEMKSSYVNGSCLTVPTRFARNYIKPGISTIKLNVGDKSWRVKLFNYQDSACRISGGWIAFAKENALKPMDTCKFELIQRNDCIFRVSIFRNTSDMRKSAGLENEKCSAGDITDKRPCLVLWDEANKLRKVEDESYKFTGTYPWFEVEMENAYIQGWCLNVPSSFARNYIKTGASTIKLNVGDNSWRVNLFKYQDGACKISAGWTAFVKENSLKPKDVCKFELIQGNSCVFKVSISRNTSDLTSCLDI